MQLSEEDVANLIKVKELIEKNFQTHYSTEYLAAVACMSRSKLTKTYRAYFGMALFEHLQRYRQIEGKKLLEQTSLSIKVIARRCGYDHSCNFSTAFKKRYGVSPVEYREMM